jgi:hypothetical protein
MFSEAGAPRELNSETAGRLKLVWLRILNASTKMKLQKCSGIRETKPRCRKTSHGDNSCRDSSRQQNGIASRYDDCVFIVSGKTPICRAYRPAVWKQSFTPTSCGNDGFDCKNQTVRKLRTTRAVVELGTSGCSWIVRPTSCPPNLGITLNPWLRTSCSTSRISDLAHSSAASLG